MVKNKTVLFEICKACQNHCWFCANKYIKETKNTVEDNLNTYIQYLNDLKDPIKIGLVGGELFDDSIENLGIKETYIELLNTISAAYLNKKITKICMFTNLIYKSCDRLKETLDLLHSNGVSFIDINLSTSFDYIGRFLQPDSLIFWENNLTFIRKTFPEIEINCEMILTNAICKKVLNNEINLNDIRNKYKFSLTLIQPYIGFMFSSKEEMNKVYPDFFLERKIFLDFCKYIIKTKQFDIEDVFTNSNETNDTFVVTESYGKAKLMKSLYENSCMGREKEHFGYIDSDKDILEDIKRIINASR